MTQPDPEETQRITSRPDGPRKPQVVHDRDTFERVLRVIREVASIIALILASLLMILLLTTIGAVGKRLSETSSVDVPVPSWTCGPTGEDPC